MNSSSIVFIPVAAVVTIATITDLRERRIPNWLVLPFGVLGLVVSAVLHGWSGLNSSLLGIAAAAGIMGLFWYMGGMGAGDLKLCTAIGAWIWPGQLVVALVTTGLIGGAMALGWAIKGGFLKQLFSGTGDLVFGLGKRGLGRHESLNLDNPATRKMPYAPAIALGTLLSFWSS